MWHVVEEPKEIKFFPVENAEGTTFRRVGGLMIRGTVRHQQSPPDQIWRVVYTNRAGRGTFSITAPDRTVERLDHCLDFTRVKAKSRAFRNGNQMLGMNPQKFQREMTELCGGNFAGSFYGKMVDAVKVALIET